MLSNIYDFDYVPEVFCTADVIVKLESEYNPLILWVSLTIVLLGVTSSSVVVPLKSKAYITTIYA